MTFFPRMDTNECCGCKEYHVRDRRTGPIEPPVEEKRKGNSASHGKAVRITLAPARGNVPDGCARQPSRESTDDPCYEAKCRVSTKTRERELTHEAARAKRQ
jgi:hypothetical protein